VMARALDSQVKPCAEAAAGRARRRVPSRSGSERSRAARLGDPG